MSVSVPAYKVWSLGFLGFYCRPQTPQSNHEDHDPEACSLHGLVVFLNRASLIWGVRVGGWRWGRERIGSLGFKIMGLRFRVQDKSFAFRACGRATMTHKPESNF